MKVYVIRKVAGGYIVECEGSVSVSTDIEEVLNGAKSYFGENRVEVATIVDAQRVVANG